MSLNKVSNKDLHEGAQDLLSKFKEVTEEIIRRGDKVKFRFCYHDMDQHFYTVSLGDIRDVTMEIEDQ